MRPATNCEKMKRRINFMVKDSFYSDFKEVCDKSYYTTVSERLRILMFREIQEYRRMIQEVQDNTKGIKNK